MQDIPGQTKILDNYGQIWTNFGLTTGTVTQAELSVVHAVGIALTFSWTCPLFAILIGRCLGCPWWTIVRFSKTQDSSRSHVSGMIEIKICGVSQREAGLSL